MTGLVNAASLRSVRLTDGNAKAVIDLVVPTLSDVPPAGAGAGYVICAGGRYARWGYVTCRWIREQLRDDAPIELWVGANETPEDFGIEGVICRTADVPGGWPLKARAVRGSAFRDVILLDADCLPFVKAALVIESTAYRARGAIFFPDVKDIRRDDWCCQALALKIGSVPEMEAGQVMIDRVKHAVAVELCDWFNQRTEFFYRHLHGDKDLWALAFARLKLDWWQGQACENFPWGLRHFMPDGTRYSDHLIHCKGGKQYSAVVQDYLEAYRGPAVA